MCKEFRLLSILFFSISSFSCQQKKEPLFDSLEISAKIQKLEDSARRSSNIEDTILLGYTFGMKESQVLTFTKRLLTQKKLKVNYLDKPYFEVETKSGLKYKGFLTAKYYSGKLYSLGLLFDEHEPMMVFYDMCNLLEQKYGPANVLNKPIESLNIYEKYWFKNNLKIKAEAGLSNATIEYIDTRFEIQQNKVDSLNKSKTEEKARNNL